MAPSLLLFEKILELAILQIDAVVFICTLTVQFVKGALTYQV